MTGFQTRYTCKAFLDVSADSGRRVLLVKHKLLRPFIMPKLHNFILSLQLSN